MIGAAAACSEPLPQTPPRQLSESTFHYPEELWNARIEGETLLEIHVSETGAVDSAHVRESSGHAEFDSAAVIGARELRFEPARRGDEPVAVSALLPVQFQMPGSEAAAPDSMARAAGADTTGP